LYCPKCGSAFQKGASVSISQAQQSAPIDDLTGVGSYGFGSNRTNMDLSVWTAVKLGAGFAIGAMLVILLVWAIVVVLLGLGIQGLSH
jgi:hypothetical protein